MPVYDCGAPDCNECIRAFRQPAPVTGDRETAGVEVEFRATADERWRAALQVEEEDPKLCVYRKGYSRAMEHAADRLAASPKAQGSDVGLREALEAVENNAVVFGPHNRPMITDFMDAVNGPTYAIYGTTMNKVRAALAASRTGQTGAGS